MTYRGRRVYHRRMSCRTSRQLLSIATLAALSLIGCSAAPVAESGPSDPSPADARSAQLQLFDQQFVQGRTLFLAGRYEEAAALLLPLARQGHLDAQYSVGYMYHYGYGLPRNYRESNRWITTAAARGHVKAQQALQLLDVEQDPLPLSR